MRVHGPNAAKNADVPLEFLHLIMQRAPDDGVLANLEILRLHQSLELSASRLELLGARLFLLRAAREGRRAGGRLRELAPSRRQRRALLLVRHAKRLQARPQRRSLGRVFFQNGASRRLLLGVLLQPLDLLRRRVQLRAQHANLRLRLGHLTLELSREILQLLGVLLRGDALGVRVGAAIASLVPGDAEVLRLGSRDFRVGASLGEFRAQRLDARLQRSSVRLQRLDLVQKPSRLFLRVRLEGKRLALGGLGASLRRREPRRNAREFGAGFVEFFRARVAFGARPRQVRRGVFRGVLESQRARFGLSHSHGGLGGGGARRSRLLARRRELLDHAVALR